MPRIDDKPIETKRPFKKKSYRPWNLMDDEFPATPKAEPEKPIEAAKNENLSAPPIEDTFLSVDVEPVPLSQIEPHKEVTPITSIQHPTEIVTNKLPNSNHLETIKKSISNQIDTVAQDKVNNSESISNRLSNHISNRKDEITPVYNRGYYSDYSVIDLLQRVSGLQKKILFSIVEDCILNGTLTSSPIPMETIQQWINTDIATTKTAVQRLLEKNLITRGHGKRGRGGFLVFRITEEIRNAVIDIQKRGSSNPGLVTNWVSNKEPNSAYSSGSNNINTTTKDLDRVTQANIPSPWDNIDIEPLNFIGFTKTHLRQIILDDKLPCEIVQDSIYAFAFDLEINNKQKNLKSPPLNFFMGIMRSGTPYAPPENYESPKDKAMRVYLEKKRELELKRQSMEEELFQSAFNEWEQKLSPEEKDSLYTDTVRNSRMTGEKISHLRRHFKEHLWQDLRNQCLLSIVGN